MPLPRTKRIASKILAFGFAALLAPSIVASTHAQQSSANQALINDYPTLARADYVFGCMAANGQTRDVLERCVCSIDLVATILPYQKYEEAETVLRTSLVGGEKTSMFKTSPALQAIVAELRRAQVEAEFRCF